MTKQLEKLLGSAKHIAKEAGEAILAIYNHTDFLTIQTKIDQTPLTQADLISHNMIVAALSKLEPCYPLLSEESEAIDFSERASWDRYWLVDPLDGTKEFIERTDEFSVLIALIEHHQPILGVIYAPVLRESYYAYLGGGAYKEDATGKISALKVRTLTKSLRIITSRRHGLSKFQPFMKQFAEHEIVNRGSALKFAAVAGGEVDIYPRFGPTSEWDTAAGQCIVQEAGGKVMNLAGEALQYNTKSSLENPEFMVVGDTAHDWLTNLLKRGE